MTLPDKTNPSRRKKRPPTGHARPANNGRPLPRDYSEDEDVTDATLYRREPDKKLQHHTLLWVGVLLLAALGCVFALAITSAPVPPLLLTAIACLAGAILIIVRHVFPGGRR